MERLANAVKKKVRKEKLLPGKPSIPKRRIP